MFMPAFFDDNFFNDFMGVPSERPQQKKEPSAIKTDVTENAQGYVLEMELPGFAKENISIKLEEGYLTVSASRKPHEYTDAKYIRKELFSGECARRFYVGKTIRQEDMKARFENGMLILSFPKEDAKKAEAAKYITIE